MNVRRFLLGACLFGVLVSALAVLGAPGALVSEPPSAAAWLALPSFALAAAALVATARPGALRASAHAVALVAGALTLALVSTAVLWPYQLAAPGVAMYALAFLLAALMLAFAAVMLGGVAVLSTWGERDAEAKGDTWDVA